ncbi:sel1 repeat family protein [Acinetobacter rudis]|uniref:sel1 repeat family protein n=1 Tax=Acinetobacter rudis TaxID=632955 RepID=UPI00280C8327|nr:sel1 repeat family protein [Acinetobacter rudis]MDQ8954250.1 sel1 repeat family protein [Acinetobacter rudis]
MIRFILALCSTLLFSISNFSYATTIPTTYTPAVAKAVQQLQQDFAALMLVDAKEIQTAPINAAYKNALLKQDEKQIKKLFSKQQQDFIQQMKKLNQGGDHSALLALVEWSLFSQDRDILQDISLQPLRQLSQQGNAQASYLSALLIEYTDQKQYISLLEQAAQQGSSAAQMRLVDEYHFRLPVELQDSKKAEYYRNLAEKSMGKEKYQEAICAVSNCEEDLEWEYVEIPMPESLKNN